MFRELSRKNKQLSAQECIRILKEEKRGVLRCLFGQRHIRLYQLAENEGPAATKSIKKPGSNASGSFFCYQ